MNKVQPIRKPKVSPPKFEYTYAYILMVFLGYLTADLITTYIRDSFLPSQPPPVSFAQQTITSEPKPMSHYDIITRKNIFNSDGVIPKKLTTDGQPQSPEDMPAEPTKLPVTLVGTIVHVNGGKSVASVELKGRGKIEHYQVDEQIENMAVVKKVERRKVFIQNLNNNRLEFMEIKEDSKINFGMKASPTTGGKEINVDGNQVKINQKFLEQQLLNIPDIVNQASGNFHRDAQGRIDGYQIYDIDPDSVLNQLGLKPNDIIKSVNNQAIDSPAKAMQVFNDFKGTKNVTITVNRNGRDEEFTIQVE